MVSSIECRKEVNTTSALLYEEEIKCNQVRIDEFLKLLPVASPTGPEPGHSCWDLGRCEEHPSLLPGSLVRPK